MFSTKIIDKIRNIMYDNIWFWFGCSELTETKKQITIAFLSFFDRISNYEKNVVDLSYMSLSLATC